VARNAAIEEREAAADTARSKPDEVDLDRRSVRDHLVFGRGLHSRPGVPMARGWIRVALETLLQRQPGLRSPTAASWPTSPVISSAGWNPSMPIW